MPMLADRSDFRLARLVAACALAGACSFPDYKVAETQAPISGNNDAAHCQNSVLDRDLGETDFDCGGGCAPCALGRACSRDVDCANATCSAGICTASQATAPSCTDGVKDGDETGPDCGGACAPCDVGQAGCSAGHADCNADMSDGCEIDLQQDAQHCGTCTTSCSNAHANSTGCSAGQCAPSCEAGFAACGSPELGCMTPLGTRQDCTKCGETCDDSAPYCQSTGCASFRDITVAADSPNGMQAWNGMGAAPVLTVQHQLQFDKGQSRIVLVGLAASGTGSGPFTVTFDDQPMIEAVELEHESRQTYSAIYYLLDDKLAAAGTQVEAKVVFHDSAWWGFGGVDVLEAANVQQKKPLLTGSSAGAVCDGQATRGVNLDFDAPGSLVYGVLSVRHALQPPSVLQVPPVTKAWSQSVSNGGDAHSGSAAWVIDDNTRNLQWSLQGCDTSSIVGLVLERLHAE